MRMLVRLRYALSSRSLMIYLILVAVAILFSMLLIPELMHTTRSFYEYNDPTYTPKDRERYIYDVQRRIQQMEKDYPVSEINKREFEEISGRIYRLRQGLKVVESQAEMRRLQQKLQALEETYKTSERPGF